MARRKKKKRRTGVEVGMPRIHPQLEVGNVSMDDPSMWPEPSEEEMMGTEVFDPEAAATAGMEKPLTRTQRMRALWRRMYPEEIARGLAQTGETSGNITTWEYQQRLKELRKKFPEAFKMFPNPYPRPEPRGLLTERSRQAYRRWLDNPQLQAGYGVPPPNVHGAPQAKEQISPADLAIVMSRSKRGR